MEYPVIGTMENGSADGIVDGFIAAIEDKQVILFTSDRKDVGKSTVLQALAESLGKHGEKVLAIDSDLRAKESWASEYGLVPHRYNQKGFLDEVHNGDYFDIVYAAMVGKKPEYVFNSNQFSTLLEDAKGIYDVVLVDSPAANYYDDAKTLAGKTDLAVAVWNPNDGEFKATKVDVVGIIENPFER